MAAPATDVFASIPVVGPIGSLLTFPLTQSIEQLKIAKQFKFNRAQPMALPDPGMLWDCYLRRIGEGTDAPFKTKWLDMALQYHGINLGQNTPDLGADEVAEFDEAIVCGQHVWRNAAAAMQEVPSAPQLLDAWKRELITEEQARKGLRRARCDVNRMMNTVPWLYGRPGMGEVLDALVRGRITPEESARFAKEAGTRLPLWEWVIPTRWTVLSLGELLTLRNRDIISDQQLANGLKKLGYGDEGILEYYQELRHQTPGIADLLRMGSRLLFTPEVAGQYGLYDGFQEQSRPYFRKLGLDYPLGFNIPVDGQIREATLPDLYWGATREILPLNAAYTAYQRLRPAQINQYLDETPNIRPFTIDDLRLHMRVAGYPPPMQDYLIALSHPPLGRRDIQWGMLYGGKDRDWAYAQYLNLGLRPSDASQVADTQAGRVAARETAWIDSLVTSAKRRTVTEIEGMYDEGILSRSQALSQLSDAELPPQLSTQLLDLSDAKRARGLLRAAITETGRDYLSGAIGADEALSALQGYGVQSQRAGELMQIWTIRRSRHRRQADTGRILKWVGQGRLSADEGRRRLRNLGWDDPDTLLLLAEAQSNLDKLHAREEKAAQADAAKRARELDRLAKQAEAEHKRLISERNRIASRGTLTKWLIDGIISQDEYRQAMRDRDYPDSAIDDYIRDALAPKPPRPKSVPALPQWPKAAGSAHPSLATFKKWLKDGVINISQYEDALRDLGYGDADIERFLTDASGTTTGNGAPPSP